MQIYAMPFGNTSPSGSKGPIENGLERAFLVEMLKVAGPKPSTGEFGGGIGEEYFFSMMNDLSAQQIAEKIDLHLK